MTEINHKSAPDNKTGFAQQLASAKTFFEETNNRLQEAHYKQVVEENLHGCKGLQENINVNMTRTMVAVIAATAAVAVPILLLVLGAFSFVPQDIQTDIYEAQGLYGMLAAVGMFISWSAFACSCAALAEVVLKKTRYSKMLETKEASSLREKHSYQNEYSLQVVAGEKGQKAVITNTIISSPTTPYLQTETRSIALSENLDTAAQQVIEITDFIKHLQENAQVTATAARAKAGEDWKRAWKKLVAQQGEGFDDFSSAASKQSRKERKRTRKEKQILSSGREGVASALNALAQENLRAQKADSQLHHDVASMVQDISAGVEAPIADTRTA